MTETWWLVWGFLIGAACGTLYFGGLWLTVKTLAESQQPERRLLISFAIRMLLLLVIFYGLTHKGWPTMITAMCGLLIARQLWLVTKGRARPTAGG